MSDLAARLEGAARRPDASESLRRQVRRAALMLRHRLVSPLAVERWLNDGADDDIGRHLVDRGLADEAALERELLARAQEPEEEPADLSTALKSPANVYGAYVRLQKVGEGGTGAVWRAWDSARRRLVALRILRADAAGLAASARVAMGIALPNVIGVVDVGRRESEAYVVSDWVPGVNLRGWSMQHGKRVGTLVSLVRSIARALHRAHEHGYLHRALRQENVVVAALGDTEVAFVGDFGMRGDPAFASPEQVRRDLAAIDRRTDVYGLGATLYAALAGNAPFTRSTPKALAEAIATAVPTSLRGLRGDVPESLAGTVARCLEKDPARRFASMRELDAALLRTSLDKPGSRSSLAAAGAVELRVETTGVAGRADLAVVALTGSITMGTLAQMQAAVSEGRQRGVRHVVLDLSGIRFISSGGFGYLISLSDELRGAGGGIALAGMRRHVQLVYESLGLDAFFQVVATREEAVRRMAPELGEAAAVVAAPEVPRVEAGMRAAELAALEAELGEGSREAARASLWRIEALLRADDKDADALALRARALGLLGDPSRAEQDFERAGRSRPAGGREGVVAAWKGTAPDRAQAEARLAREPASADALHMRALARRASGDLLGALQDLNRVLELAAGCPEAYVTYALVMRALGDRAQSIEQFERALALAPPGWPLRPHVLAMAGAAR